MSRRLCYPAPIVPYGPRYFHATLAYNSLWIVLHPTNFNDESSNFATRRPVTPRGRREGERGTRLLCLLYSLFARDPLTRRRCSFRSWNRHGTCLPPSLSFSLIPSLVPWISRYLGLCSFSNERFEFFLFFSPRDNSSLFFQTWNHKKFANNIVSSSYYFASFLLEEPIPPLFTAI